MTDENDEIAQLRRDLTDARQRIARLENHITHPPKVSAVLDFIRERKIVASKDIAQQFGPEMMWGGTRGRLNYAMKHGQDFILLLGANRYLPTIYAFDDESNDPRLIIFRLYQGMKPQQSISHHTLVEVIARDNTQGNLDQAQEIVTTLFSPSMQTLMKGRIEFAKTKESIRKV